MPPSTSFCAYCQSGSSVIEVFGAFARNAPADEALQRAQGAVIFRRHEADGIAHRVGAAGAADAVDVVLGMHREVIIHHVRNAIDIDPPGCDIGRDQHAHGPAFEIFQGAQALVLRAV
jgi:hypothetical protein